MPLPAALSGVEGAPRFCVSLLVTYRALVAPATTTAVAIAAGRRHHACVCGCVCVVRAPNQFNILTLVLSPIDSF